MQHRTMLAALALLALAAAPVMALDYVSVADGNWGSTSTWSPAGVPGQVDNVSIGHRVVLEASYAVNNLTIASGGKFVISGAYSAQVYGSWTNNGTDSLVNGYVFFKGPGAATIDGTNPTSFWRLYVSKSDTLSSVTLNQNVSARYPGSFAVSVDTGNFVTNGRNLDASVTNARVGGTFAGRFRVTGASTVSIYYLYQWGLGYFFVSDANAVVNIFRQDIANAQHRMDISAGTVNYTGTGTNLNLQLFTNNTGWGWYATGGTITFNGSIACGNFVTCFQASGTAVIRFVGSASSYVNLHGWSSGSPRVAWWFNDLRIEKTGGAVVRFYQSGSAETDSFVRVQTALTVNPGTALNLAGTFAAGKGYRFPTVTNNGTVNDSAPMFVSGDLTGSGTFAAGTGGAVTFDGTGISSVNQPATFHDLAMNKTGGGSLAIFRDLPVGGTFRAIAGTFALGKRTLTLGTDAASGGVSVDSGATFLAVGGADTASVVTALSAGFPYAFSVASGGTIGARHAQFLYPDTLGVSIAGSIDPANDFDSCAFEHGTSTGPMLKIENSQTLDGLDHVAFSGTAGSNIEKLGSSGHVTVTLGGGTRWGEAFDTDPSNLVDWVGPDAGVSLVLAPVGQVPLSTVVTPQVRLHNYGQYPATFDVTLQIADSLGAVVYDTTETGISLTAGDSIDRYFSRTWTAGPRGAYSVTAWTASGEPGNDTARAAFEVVGRDVGISAITAPVGAVPPGTNVAPAVRVTNYGIADAVTGVRLILSTEGGTVVYDTLEEGIAVAAGATESRTFTKTWLAEPEGRYRVLAYTTLEFDINPANDTGRVGFQVGSAPPSGGWVEVAQVPVTPSGKLVKDGGAVSYDNSRAAHYVLKGYKTGDFYRYDQVLDAWTALPEMPLGVENKGPYKGANLCSDGNGTFYVTKGNNTSGFWKYAADDSLGTWTQLADVPLGLSNKKVKGGTDLVYVQDDTTGWVYLLKGYKTEFYRYNTATGTWETLTDAPTGVKAKYDKGSWLAYDAPNRTLYAHKAKYMEMYTYSVDSAAWSPLLPGMPLSNGQTGKNKKSKDGGDAVLLDGVIWALKGGNTQDFYAYDIATSTWAEKETIPAVGTTGKKKRVKAGGSITTDGTVLYAL
ncbi:MAG: hypothetical protein R6X13_11195, partial [bacterium]